MGDVKSFYPEFVPNQILTNTQLNQLREHLDLEQRRTRLRLSGAGIVCGLTWHRESREGKPSIRIDTGYGVTSDGYLIELCTERVCTHWRNYSDPDVDEDKDPRYEPWQKSGDRSGQKDILELIEAERMAVEEPPEGAQELKTDTADGRVLVLYLEKEAEDLNSCLVTSCDNKGFNINLNVRALLLKKEDLEPLPQCLPVPRPVLVPRLPKKALVSTDSADFLNKVYGKIVEKYKEVLAKAIDEAFSRHGKFLDLGGPSIARLLEALAGAPDQYRYDALKDLAQAHNEAAAAAHNLIAPCCPEHHFPRHLQLGDAAGALRHGYHPAAARNVPHGELERARGLMLRITEMIGRLAFEPREEVSIAPSHTEAHSLERRTVPFYFSRVADAKWSPPAPCTADTAWPWRGSGAVPTLEFDYNQASFLRIEGHVGKECDEAAAAIRNRRSQQNLEFDLLCAHFADTLAEEQGVPKEVEALFKAREKLLGRTRAIVEEYVATGEGDPEELVKTARGLDEILAGLAKLAGHWGEVRLRRRLHCDIGPLEKEYLAARSALICAYSRLHGALARLARDVARLKEGEVTGQGLEAMLQGVPDMLVDRVTVAVAVEPSVWQKPDKFPLDPRKLAKLTPSLQLRLALRLAVEALGQAVRRLLEENLPNTVLAFQPTLFARRHKELARDLLQLWLWIESLGLPLAGMSRGRPGGKLPVPIESGDAPLDRAEEFPLAHDLLGIVLDCACARLVTMCAALEAIRGRDTSLFANLAARVDGIEHLAGVEKGGSFILVCDKPGPRGKVVADFSLAGRLPCCCHFQAADACVPPLAINDHRVVILDPREDGKGYRPVSLAIVVRANDCDLSLDPGAEKPKAGWEALSDRTALGGRVEATDEPGVLQYSFENPRPGMVDYFPYRFVMESDKCRGEDIAHVVIALRVPPDLTGQIAGEVLSDAAGVPAPGATVTVIETGDTAIAGGKGQFTFTGLEARSYALQAKLGDRSSPAQPVIVSVGETTHATLVLAAAPIETGTVVARVKDKNGPPIGSARVGLVEIRTKAVRMLDTNAAGEATFTGLDPGGYVAAALATGFAGAQEKVEISAGATVTVELVLVKMDITVGGNTVTAVAEATGLGLIDAAKVTKDAYASRYTKRVSDFEAASQDPIVLTSEAHKAAAAFLYETVSNPEKSDAELAAAYEAAATPLAAAAKQASGAEKAAYQEMLAAASLAYMDRVALNNPKKLAADSSSGMRVMSAALKEAGVSADQVKTGWAGDALRTDLGVKTTAAMLNLVG